MGDNVNTQEQQQDGGQVEESPIIEETFVNNPYDR